MHDHRKSEKEILEFWKTQEIYRKVKDKNKGNEPYYFCDGPPYATGQIHPGTGWNKTIKDSFCRYYRALGRDVRFQPGFDTHGLPIEVKVEQELKFTSKNDIEKYGMEKFIDECKSFATKYIGIMSGQFESLGVWADYDTPYITYKDSYIESSWKTIAMAREKGLLYEGVYVLPYCYRCETTIANYELEYADETDPSIFVKFRVLSSESGAAGKAKSDKKGKPPVKDENTFLIIWTTTPWTLVSNMGVMVHPTLAYVKTKVDGEVWIVAKDRLDYLMKLLDKSAVVLEEIPGRKLKDLQYEHPFQDKITKTFDRKVVLSDEYVTLEEGTGLVHMAPGHGPADFVVGKRAGIEPFSPVDEHGNYTAEAGRLVGKNVREANPLVLEILKDNGSLIREERIRHRYPHCWRCKTPLIFLTTKQWFIAISKIKDQMLAELDKTAWYPMHAKERFREFVTGAPDWCISRQRYWGIPLPIWKCDSCGDVSVLASRDKLPKLKELHRPYIDEIEFKCENCGKSMHRIPDVLDVWFDSGNAVWASLTPEEAKHYSERANLVIEGQDQIRGWFYSLLGSGVIRYGECPYKKLLMHGFFVDEKGEKMSKSVGNFVPIEQILEKYGADSFRLWGMGNTTWEELKFSWDEMKKCNSDLNIAANMVSFLERAYPVAKSKTLNPNENRPSQSSGPVLEPMDEWLISRMHSTLKEFHEGFETCEPNRSAKALRFFLVEDLSRFYMKVAKDRIGKSDNAEAAFYVIYTATLASLQMLSIFSPFISEHLYQKFFRKMEKAESIYLLRMPKSEENLIDAASEKKMESVKELVTVALLARQNSGIKLRWPIRTLHIETKSHEVQGAAETFKPTLLGLLNTKELAFCEAAPGGEIASAPFSSGMIHVDKKIDEELYEEGMVNEVKRRIQIMRKEAQLVEKDSIEATISCEKELEAIVKKHEKRIRDEVNAKSVFYGPAAPGMSEYEIDGRLVKIAIKKV